MRTTKKLSFLQYSLLVLLVAAAAVFLSACGAEKSDTTGAEITITIEVIGPDGTSTEHDVTTTSTNLEGAFLDSGFVTGDDGPYGLYIKVVDGISADYDKDGAYWGMSKNGEYLMTGAKDTPIAEGEHYELVYTLADAVG